MGDQLDKLKRKLSDIQRLIVTVQGVGRRLADDVVVSGFIPRSVSAKLLEHIELYSDESRPN